MQVGEKSKSILRTLMIGKGALLTRSWNWWWLNWTRQKWGSLIRSSPRTASIVGRWYDSNIFNLFQKSGIDKLLPEMKMDDFLFSPIGYSMNGIMKEVAQKFQICTNPQGSEEHNEPSFMTIHVTPQVDLATSLFICVPNPSQAAVMPALRRTALLPALVSSARSSKLLSSTCNMGSF